MILTSTKVQVHTAAQSGISEIAIAVADALGAGSHDDGKRIFDPQSQLQIHRTPAVQTFTQTVYTVKQVILCSRY